MIGTHEDIDDAENVILIAFIEEENLRCAREKNFNGIFTTNTNPLTQVNKILNILKIDYSLCDTIFICI